MIKTWSEASNRRLRNLILKGYSVGEAALFLDCSAVEVAQQLRRLGVVPPVAST
jgi:hypothetical protein